MPETFSGVLTELGGPELGKSGNEKPRKVIIKEDVAKQYGKTFRCWSSNPEWDDLQELHGKPITVEFVVEQPDYLLPNGQKPNPSNMIVGVIPTEASSNGEGGAGDWGVPSEPVWGSAGEVASTQSPAPSSAPASKDDYWEHKTVMDEQRQHEISASWAIREAIDLLSVGASQPPPQEQVLSTAHQLLVMKDQIVSEISA